jgi:LPXTG-motif cell wall-anchored protein
VVDPFTPDVPPQPGFAPDGSGTPLFTTRPEIFQPAPARVGPNWMLILGIGAAVVVGGYLLTRRKPRANPRRRRRRRRRR